VTVATAPEAVAATLFDRVLVGVDGSAAGLQAACQGARLVAPDGTLELAKAIYLIDANLQNWPQEQIDATLEREGRPALQAAAAVAGPRATTRLLNGPSKQALVEEAARTRATLIVVGSHGHSRLSEMLIGGVAGPLLHEAPCSVLIARPAASEALFPQSVIVGVDGSPASLAALAAGRSINTRFDAALRVVPAGDGSAVDVLTDASASADLVVVASRGLRGLSALGSVSERLAHRAHSSVLVVRPHGGSS
jgi:nucleotide-binding universal stress UspA family protein